MEMGVNSAVHHNGGYLNQGHQNSTGPTASVDENTENFDVDMFLVDGNENTKGNESVECSSETEDDEGITDGNNEKLDKEKRTKKRAKQISEGEPKTRKSRSGKKSKGRTKRRIVACLQCREANRQCDGKIPCVACIKANKHCRPGRAKSSLNKYEQREGGELEEDVGAEQRPNSPNSENTLPPFNSSGLVLPKILPQIIAPPHSRTLPRISKALPMSHLINETLPQILPQNLPQPLHTSPTHRSSHIAIKSNSQTKYTARRTTVNQRDANSMPDSTTLNGPEPIEPRAPMPIAEKISNIRSRVARKKKGEKASTATTTSSSVMPNGSGKMEESMLELPKSDIEARDLKEITPVKRSLPPLLPQYLSSNYISQSELLPPLQPPKSTGTKRARAALEDTEWDDSNDTPDGDSTEEIDKGSKNRNQNVTHQHRPKRQRKRTESVQRAIEEELQTGKKKRKGKTKTTKEKKPKTSDQEEGEEEEEEEEKLPEDGVLAIDKFLLKRYNTVTKQCEYLVQWNGYDIHRSAWIVKKDIFAADYLSEFENDWAERLRQRKKNTEDNNDNNELDVGDKVWVKLKGHQWWPAQVVVRTKPAEDKNDYTVVFYGDNTFAFVNDYTANQFLIERFEGFVAKFRRKANEKAVKEALSMLPDEPE